MEFKVEIEIPAQLLAGITPDEVDCFVNQIMYRKLESMGHKDMYFSLARPQD